MIHTYQFTITIKQQLNLFVRVPLIWTAVAFGAIFILHIDLTNIAFIITGILLFTIDTLPTIAVHLQYWKINHDALLEIDTQVCTITYTSPNQNSKYSFQDISTLHYYYSYVKNSGWHSFGVYRYYKIIFRDGKEIIITCLMMSNIDKILEDLLGIKAGKHGQLICLTS